MDFRYEQQKINQGYQQICGIDEVGRGPLAGPIVAAAVILDPQKLKPFEMMKESKSLKEEFRDEFAKVIKMNAIAWAIGEVSPEEIDEYGIAISNALVMQRAAQDLKIKPDFIVLDRMSGFRLNIPHDIIIKGDENVLSIAAASILAKVYRDKLMVKFAQQYPQYGFDQHKGYGTRLHLEKIREFGPCPIHRQSFEPIKPKLFDRLTK
jgi:ribonuclease HII